MVKLEFELLWFNGAPPINLLGEEEAFLAVANPDVIASFGEAVSPPVLFTLVSALPEEFWAYALDMIDGLAIRLMKSSNNLGNSGTQSASNNIGPKLQTIINGMSNDVQSSNADIQSLAKNMEGIQKSIADIKSSVDRSYMIAIVGIGAGVAGIIMAAVSLSRKQILGFH